MSDFIEDTASELENLIADFIPNEDKDVSRDIALAVVNHVASRVYLGTTPDSAKDKLVEVVRHMSMAEYTMMRDALVMQLKEKVK